MKNMCTGEHIISWAKLKETKVQADEKPKKINYEIKSKTI